jgi:hypothetical protein
MVDDREVFFAECFLFLGVHDGEVVEAGVLIDWALGVVDPGEDGGVDPGEEMAPQEVAPGARWDCSWPVWYASLTSSSDLRCATADSRRALIAAGALSLDRHEACGWRACPWGPGRRPADRGRDGEAQSSPLPEAGLPGEDDRLTPRAHPELIEDRRHLIADRLLREVKPFCDVGVGASLR